MPTKKKCGNPHSGSTLDDFLREEGTLQETRKIAKEEFLKKLKAQPVRKLKVSPAEIIRQERARRSRHLARIKLKD
jgi:hypothetical protein